MSKTGFLLFLMILATLLFADNEFIIESFKALPSDMSGSVYAKKDGNNEFCGLIKVKTGISKDLDFDSGLKFNIFEKKKPGEYWVYVSPGEGRLTLFAEGFVPKHFQISTVKIESKRTYEMVVRAKEEQKIPVSILSEPSDAEKLLDGTSLGTGDNFQVVPGNYLLTVRKQGYKDYTRQIQVDKDNALFKSIVLNRIEPLEVQISSNPPGAEIYIDNTLQGRTNMGLYIYPGKYHLKIIQSGYLDVVEEIAVSEGNVNRFSFTLLKNTGVLEFSIFPVEVKLLINKIDYSGKKKLELAPGTYLIETSKPGYYDKSEVVELKRGEVKTVNLELEQKTGRLQVSISPLEANCILSKDGKEILNWAGMKDIRDLPVGSYELSCSYSGYKTQKRSITIMENQTLPLKIQMEEGISYSASQHGIEEVFVEGGSFRMGDVWGGGDSDEKPVRSVTLRSFYIAKHEVTQALYKEIMGTNPSYFKGDNLPVERVTWYNAVEFCNKLSEKVGLQKVYKINGTNVTADFTKNGYRLPTEAEWEYAARSGGRNDRKWSGTNTESELGNYAWYDKNSGSKTHPVGTKQPNDLGIYDMSGNVWEWCWDWKGSYSSSSQTNPTGSSTGSYRVERGGSWSDIAGGCRSAVRYSDTPTGSSYDLGLRLARNGG